MIARAMRGANAPVRIPINTELQHHATTNNLSATNVNVKHFSTEWVPVPVLKCPS